MENKKTRNNGLNYFVIQQRGIKKIQYFKDCLKFLEGLSNIIKKNANNFEQLNAFKENIIDNEEKIYLITHEIIETLINIEINFQKLIENIINKLNMYLYAFNEEQIKFKSFDEIYKIFQQKKKKLLEAKNIYHQNGKELEEFAIKFFESNEIPSKELNNLIIKNKRTFKQI